MKNLSHYTFLLIVILSLLSSNFVFSQKAPIKFGKVSKEELEMKVYEKDTSAEAVVLADYSRTEISYDDQDGFMVRTNVIRRIKILKKAGLDYASVEIPYYFEHAENKERINKLKAQSYSLEGGKIITTKLSKKEVFNEDRSRHRKLKKFAIPNVKVGSVIEYTYLLTSPFLRSLKTWYFQRPIPVKWSEYRIETPEYFNYKHVFGGYLSSDISEVKNSAKTIMLTNSTASNRGLGGTKRETTTDQVKYVSTINRWVYKDVPAFRTEKYITTPNDYYARIEFELLSVNYPNSAEKTYTASWDEIGRKLMETDHFGGALNRKITKELADEINSRDLPLTQKVAIAYQSICKHMKWNGEYYIFIENTLRSAFNDHTGNVAEVNLALVNLLRGVGVESYPIVLSTRLNGQINTIYPRRSVFNYVIASAVVDGKTILLDATADFLIPGQLPFRCMNGRGLVVKENKTDWINLRTSEQMYMSISTTLKMDSDGGLTGVVVNRFKGENASNLRHKIRKDGKDRYIENIIKDRDDWEIENIQITNESDFLKTLVKNIQISEFNNIDAESDIIYLPVVIDNSIEENPFENETRKYPVDFGMPKHQKYVMSFTLPDNYKVEELPEKLVITLPDKAAVFTFQAQLVGKTLQVYSQLKINKPVFAPEEYKLLREFYTHVIEKLNEQIVLKRI